MPLLYRVTIACTAEVDIVFPDGTPPDVTSQTIEREASQILERNGKLSIVTRPDGSRPRLENIRVTTGEAAARPGTDYRLNDKGTHLVYGEEVEWIEGPLTPGRT